MTLKNDAKFKGKLTRGFKNDKRNLVNFHESSQKPENLHLDELILWKHTKFKMKKYKSAMSQVTEE